MVDHLHENCSCQFCTVSGSDWLVTLVTECTGKEEEREGWKGKGERRGEGSRVSSSILAWVHAVELCESHQFFEELHYLHKGQNVWIAPDMFSTFGSMLCFLCYWACSSSELVYLHSTDLVGATHGTQDFINCRNYIMSAPGLKGLILIVVDGILHVWGHFWSWYSYWSHFGLCLQDVWAIFLCSRRVGSYKWVCFPPKTDTVIVPLASSCNATISSPSSVPTKRRTRATRCTARARLLVSPLSSPSSQLQTT